MIFGLFLKVIFYSEFVAGWVARVEFCQLWQSLYRWDFWKERKWIRCWEGDSECRSQLLSLSDYAAVQIRSPRTRPTRISTETNLTKRLWSAPRPVTAENTWRTRTSPSRRTLTILTVSIPSQIVTVTSRGWAAPCTPAPATREASWGAPTRDPTWAPTTESGATSSDQCQVTQMHIADTWAGSVRGITGHSPAPEETCTEAELLIPTVRRGATALVTPGGCTHPTTPPPASTPWRGATSGTSGPGTPGQQRGEWRMVTDMTCINISLVVRMNAYEMQTTMQRWADNLRIVQYILRNI